MELILLAASTLCSSLPMVAILGLVWIWDRYDREPLWLVLLTFFWGAIGAVFFALPLNTAFGMAVDAVIAPALGQLGIDPAFTSETLGPAIGAPLFEEPSKALFLLFIAWNRRPHDMSSGFVYGAAAGLGFGMTENFLYFSSVASDFGVWASTVVLRTLFSAMLHTMASAIVGASFGFGRLRGLPILILSTTGGLLAAMVVHGLWNGLITLDRFSPADLSTANYVLLPMEVLFVFVVWQVCLLDDSLAIRRELQEEEDAGTLSKDHSWIVASWWRRMFQDFVPEGLERGRYVRTVTALARRKRQLRLLGTRAPDFYRDDLRRLRRQLEMWSR